MPLSRIALVSCVKTKLDRAAPAEELYTSSLFRKMRTHAIANADAWFILSAEHGLLRPDEMVEPYERTLNKMSSQERNDWADRVRGQLAAALPHGARVMFLAGERYRSGLVPYLLARGHDVTVPMLTLAYGKQLQWLTRQAERRAKDS